MCTISVQSDALEALAGELAALAAELDEDATLSRTAASALYTALDGAEGWTSGGAAIARGSLTGVVAARTAAVAGTLGAAAVAYRAADATLAADVAVRRARTAAE